MTNYESLYTEEQRNKLIKKEYKRLVKSLDDLDESRKITLDRLFQEAAFMAVTLEETRIMIIKNGVIEEYQNGANQKGLKKAAAVEVYDKTVNTYIKVLDQINKALPEGKKIDPSEEIMKFAFGVRK